MERQGIQSPSGNCTLVLSPYDARPWSGLVAAEEHHVYVVCEDDVRHPDGTFTTATGSSSPRGVWLGSDGSAGEAMIHRAFGSATPGGDAQFFGMNEIILISSNI